MSKSKVIKSMQEEHIIDRMNTIEDRQKMVQAQLTNCTQSLMNVAMQFHYLNTVVDLLISKNIITREEIHEIIQNQNQPASEGISLQSEDGPNDVDSGGSGIDGVLPSSSGDSSDTVQEQVQREGNDPSDEVVSDGNA